MAMNHTYVIHTPCGYVKLDMSRYHEIMESPEMQRLDDIQQVPFSDFLYPKFNHTRLEHSLGSHYISSIAADELLLNEEDAEILRVASLLHDNGHPALSHVLECVTGQRNSDVSAENVMKMSGIISKFADPEKVAKTVGKNGHYLSPVLSSLFGIDKLDYQYRDWLHAQIGGIDECIMEILYNSSIVDDEDGKHYCIKEGYFLPEYINLWEKLHNDVYFNPETLKARAMIERAVLSEFGREDAKKLLSMTDGELYRQLKSSENPVTVNIVEMLEKKKTYETVIGFKKNGHADFSNRFPAYDIGDMGNADMICDPKKIRAREKELSDRFGIPYGTVIISPDMRESETTLRGRGGLTLDHDNNVKKFEDAFTEQIDWIDNKCDRKYLIQVAADPNYRNAVVSGFSGKDPIELVFG